MRDHSKKWHQRAYLIPTWGCAVCNEGNNVYQNPEALHAHLSEGHPEVFPPEYLDVISRQSKMERPRASNECLLCCFTIKNLEPEAATTLPKRQKVQLENENRKIARTTLAMYPHASRKIADAALEEPDRSVTTIGTDQSLENAETMARHIASHLQALMLLLMRVASIQNVKPDDGDDANSDSVDIGDGDGMLMPSQRDTPRGSGVVDTEMQDIEAAEEHTVFHPPDMLSEETPAPDADVDTTSLGVKTEFDHLSPEQDDFLQKLIQSGASQAPEEKDASRHASGNSSDPDSDSDKVSILSDHHISQLFVASELDQSQHRRGLTDNLNEPYESLLTNTVVQIDWNEVINAVLEMKAGLDSQDEHRGTALPSDAELSRDSFTKALADPEAFLNDLDDEDQTPLLLASKVGHEKVVELLLNTGQVNIESKDVYEQTPLSWAAEKGHKAVVSLLLERGADIESKDKFRWTPLLWAVEKRHKAVVSLLLERGADIKSKDKYGWTPLSRAVREGHQAAVSLL